MKNRLTGLKFIECRAPAAAKEEATAQRCVEVDDGLLHLSVGIEDTPGLIADLEQGLPPP